MTARKTKGRADTDAALVGASGVGRAWRPDDRDDGDGDAFSGSDDDESEASDVGEDSAPALGDFDGDSTLIPRPSIDKLRYRTICAARR